MRDVIVVGSGAAGVAAALEFADCGLTPLVLDVGHRGPAPAPITENLYEYRRHHDTFDLTMGEQLQGLSNLLADRQVPVKLTSPHTEYVTRDAATLSPIDETAFCAIQSFACGGLANAWGAGLYRYTDDDLLAFPVRASDLDPFFDKLTSEIGIGGEEDDLSGDFGSTRGLHPPLMLSQNMHTFYRAYRRRRTPLVRIGRARVAALSQAREGRPPYPYRSLDFFQEVTSVYSPRYTLDRLLAEGKIDLHANVLVESFHDVGGHVRAEVRDLDSNERRHFEAKKLVLAAGTINTSKIVLRSYNDFESTLNLLENPALQLPLVLPSRIGCRLDTEAFGLVQLNLVWDSPTYEARLQGSIMEITAPTRAEFFAGLPFSARGNLALIRRLLPGMLVMQVFFPAASQAPAKLSLQQNGRLRIEGQPNTLELSRLRPLISYLRRLGAWTHRRLAVPVPTGHAVHYAGTLPMKETPGRYECSPEGRLGGKGNVFIADSASFSDLTAKNMSFGMMANAMRIARGAAREVQDL